MRLAGSKSRSKLVLVVAVAVAVIAAVVGSSTPEHLSYRASDFYSHESEGFSAAYELESIQPEDSLGVPNIAVISRGNRKKTGVRIRRELRKLPQVAKVVDHIFLSRDGRSNYIVGWLKRDLSETSAAVEVEQRLERPGVQVGGAALVREQFGEQIKRDLWRAELIAFPLLVLFGLLIFRSVVSALLPVVVGGFSLLCALAAMRLMTDLFPLSVFALNLGSGLALGLGVDYSLLMVSRFREELARGLSTAEASRTTLRTAGRMVAFSSVAIAAAFCSLLVFPIPFVRSIAAGGIVVALIAGLAAIVLLPALFSLLGARVNDLGLSSWRRAIARNAQPRQEGAWYRVAQFAVRRPVMIATASGLFLLLLALPSLSMRFTGLDSTSLPAGSSTRVFAERLRDDFEHPLVGEIGIAIHADVNSAEAVVARTDDLSEKSKLGIPFPVGLEHAPELWQVNINPTHPVFSSETQEFVHRLRSLDAPIGVTGETANYIDTVETLKQRLPYALAVLVGATFVVLFFATGSLILPIKALIMNLLSLGAAFGVLVVIFQDGRLEQLLDYETQGAFVVTLPIVMGAGAFGLLTDYGLFLLMRIKEAREEGASDAEAIAFGVERTARVVTAAACLFCIAIGAFATSGVLFVKEGAIGIVIAVLLDVLVVRPLLVPSLMAIMGKLNWWPRGLPVRSQVRPDSL